MNEGLADGAGDFNVFSALNGDANFQDLSSEIDDDAAELNLVEAVASGEKIDTSFAEENEAETTEECLSDERRSEICQNVVSAACASCAAAGTCSILRMRNFAKENLQPVAEEPKSYLSDLMNDDCDFVVAGYVSADNEENPPESIEKDSPSENEKAESIPEKPAVKSEVSDDDASMHTSAESNEANEPTDDECLDSESVSSENIPSVKIVKENIQPRINEEPEETEAASQINLVDPEDVDEKVDIHKEDMSSENQAPQFVDKEDELPRELPIKKDNYIGAENDINSAPILEDSTPKEDLVEKVIPNELISSPVRDFVQVNNEIDMAMKDDDNNAPAETELSDGAVRERTESVELTENRDNSLTLPQCDLEEREVYFEDSENVAVAEISDDRAVVSKTDNTVDELGDCAELSKEATRELDDLGDRVELDEEGVCELEELPTSKSEIIGQFIPNLKLAGDEIGQNNIVDKVVKKVAEKTELAEECSELIAMDDCDESKCSVKIEESSDCCDDTDNALSRELNTPVFQEIPTLPDDSSEEKANYNCDEDDANNTNISGVYSGLWADDSPLNPEDDKTSNVSYNSSVLSQLIALVGSLAVRIVIKKQEELCK
ncbi:hypothetical protein [Candidatus Nanosynbacter sp. TM7-057]|uniref:hypothetical protein n=1 Tax=Candidatus Nanosynbacter sp. TM7-057 TaxID=2902630 RepID=UPI001FB76984|nr:hypothetical protein [Candidatus Nanosynbacter sp. TM7-057]MCJ1964799.1 hypothetical protein [Candidatus Nanosynbacter sp. TM7-057]